MAMQTAARERTIHAIQNLQSFTERSIKGVLVKKPEEISVTGMADADERQALRKLLTEDKARYVVFSYATPIAWYTRDGLWVVSQQHYSQTTTQHQRLVQLALDTK